jgi:hypothetical protein
MYQLHEGVSLLKFTRIGIHINLVNTYISHTIEYLPVMEVFFSLSLFCGAGFSP